MTLQRHAQRLIFGGRQLKEGATIAEYSIVDGCTVHLVPRLMG
jgi:hypothetical protein